MLTSLSTLYSEAPSWTVGSSVEFFEFSQFQYFCEEKDPFLMIFLDSALLFEAEVSCLHCNGVVLETFI